MAKKKQDKEKEQDMIKLHITFKEKGGPGGESCWAEHLTKTTARIQNIPFFHGEFGLNDIVEFADQGEDGYYEFEKVIERKTKTIGFEYEAKEGGDLKDVFKGLHDYFEVGKKIPLEGMMAGIASIAIPHDMTDDELTALMEGAPTVCAPLA